MGHVTRLRKTWL